MTSFKLRLTILATALIHISLPANATSATGEESPALQSAPSVETLGQTIYRGMPEPEVRAVLPNLRCVQDPDDPGMQFCGVSEENPLGDDGEVTFKNGFVHSATRNWFIPEDTDPVEVLMMVHNLFVQLIGTDKAACAKISTWNFQDPYYTILSLPEKYITFQLHQRDGNAVAGHIKESTRINPVPSHFKTQGRIMRGNEWCGYVN